jgi:hypothetical protein
LVLTLYVTAAIVGGALLAVNLLKGDPGDGADLSGDSHAVDSGADGWGLVLPLFSLSFWTFFIAFFGLAGTLLSFLPEPPGRYVIAGASVATGLGSGFAMAHLLRQLRQREVHSSVGQQDFVGALGKLLLPVGRGAPGKVRLSIKGRTFDLIAHSDTDAPLAVDEQVVVHDVTDEGEVKVVSAQDTSSIAGG